MFPNRGYMSDVDDVHSSNHGNHEEFVGDENSQENGREQSHLTEENSQLTEENSQGTEGKQSQENKQTEGGTGAIPKEIRSREQRLLDGKRNDQCELKDILKEANTKEQKFHMDEYPAEEGKMSRTINDLPHELMRSIFLMLPLEDRKMAVLVSRWWRQVGEDPVLWKRCIIKIRSGDDINKLSIPRIKHVKKIWVDRDWNVQAQQLKDLLEATLELPKLKNFPHGASRLEGVKRIDFRSVDSPLLVRALGRLEKLFLTHDTTTNDQKVAVFNHMAENRSTKKLTVDMCNDFPWNLIPRPLEVEAEILSKAMSGVEQLVLEDVSLNTDQAQKLVEQMSESNRLKSIVLSGADMSSADPKLFAKAMSKLEQITLNRNNLTNQQAQQLLTKMKQNSSKISLLHIFDNDLSRVDRNDLASVVNNIEDVVLYGTHLSADQITAVLRRVQTNTKLQNLGMTGFRISHVDFAIFTRAKEIIGKQCLTIYSEGEDDSSDEEEDEDDSSDEEEDDDDSSDEGTTAAHSTVDGAFGQPQKQVTNDA